MPFLSFGIGSFTSLVTPTNPYLAGPNCRAHIILAHPTESNGLILTRGGDDAYKRGEDGYLKGDGRSIVGSLKMNGASVIRSEAECNFIVDLAMANHFKRLLALQRESVPVTVIDNWITGRSLTFNADISIADKNWETSKPMGFFLLQFALFEN